MCFLKSPYRYWFSRNFFAKNEDQRLKIETQLSLCWQPLLSNGQLIYRLCRSWEYLLVDLSVFTHRVGLRVTKSSTSWRFRIYNILPTTKIYLMLHLLAFFRRKFFFLFWVASTYNCYLLDKSHKTLEKPSPLDDLILVGEYNYGHASNSIDQTSKLAESNSNCKAAPTIIHQLLRWNWICPTTKKLRR